MKITSELLKSKGACLESIALFVKLGGNKLELTEELCIEHASKFDWCWAARHLLSASAKADYDRVKASAFFNVLTKEKI